MMDSHSMEIGDSSTIDGFINEIESSEAPLGPILRVVYENECQEQFFHKLDERIKTHDKEIERMCNYNYQGFVESVGELIRVRTDAKSLKIQVKTANRDLQASGHELLYKLDELVGHRVVHRNIATTIETLTLCLPVLEMYAKLIEQRKQKRYYPALKTLEQLENTYLARIKSFRFAEIMKGRLPAFRDGIKNAAKEDLMLFLEDVRAKSEKLGEIAMKQAHQHYSLTLSHGVDEGLRRTDYDLDTCPPDLVDFSPVYRCLHIFNALGQREVFEKDYRKERIDQARQAFEWQRGLGSIHESLNAFQAYFHSIVGFFVVDDTVMNTTEGLVSRGMIDELWKMAVSKIGSVLRSQCSNLPDAALMLKVKELIVWFSHTLSGYGFSVTSLYDVLLQIRDQYNEMLAKNWTAVFDKIGSEDNYSPLYIDSADEMKSNYKEFPFEDSNVKTNEFPLIYPYSAYVPDVYAEIKNYVKASIRFNEHLNISRTEIDQCLRTSTNLLLTKILSGSLKKLIGHPHLSLAQLIQISVNTMHLESSCPDLEKFISKTTGTANEGISVTRLYGSSTFKDIRAEAEQKIFEKLNSKMDEFLSLANYNWVPTVTKIQPSGYLVDLLAYLQGAFITFETLPGGVAKTACMSSCKHLSSNLKAFLTDDEVKQVNVHGLQGFSIDLRECETFAKSKPVAGFVEDTLEMSFYELRQIIDLLLKSDWSTFLSDYGTMDSKYNRVQPQVVVKLLEKMNENKKNSLFTKSSDKEKKKLMDTIIKRLKNIDHEQR